MVSEKYPIHSSFRLGLESRLGLGLSLSLGRGGWVVSGNCPTHPPLGWG